MKINHSLGVVCLLLRYLGETIVKVVLFLITCAVLIGLGIYIGYSVDLGIRFDLIEKYPAIVVGGVAAAMALLGVFINQIGQYVFHKLKVKEEKEKKQILDWQLLEKEFFLKANVINQFFERMIEASASENLAFCNSFYAALTLRGTLIDSPLYSTLKAEYDKLYEEYIHMKNNYFEAKNNYYEAATIIKYFCLKMEFYEEIELYENFETEIFQMMNCFGANLPLIIEEYNEHIGKEMDIDKFLEKYPSPYAYIKKLKVEALENYERDFGNVYQRLVNLIN